MIGRRFRILRLSGFDVSVDASWFLVALLVIWALAASTFPTEYPHRPLGLYVAMGILGALGFFVSLVVHEFCHAVVARRYGLPMNGITLWLLGGVAEMSDEPPSAKAEFLMAGAGPLASAVLAAVCLGLAAAGRSQGWTDLATGTLSYLGRINLILLLFNLVPAYPLDGGRLLRSTLWAWKGQMAWATRIAARIGAAFGMLLILFGILTAVSGDVVSGIWDVMIGLFIRFAAQSSYTQLLVRDSLKGLPARRFLRPATFAPRDGVDVLAADADALTALERMSRSRRPRLLVVDQGRPVGSVEQGDLLSYAADKLRLPPRRRPRAATT